MCIPFQRVSICIKADSHVSVHLYEYNVRSIALVFLKTIFLVIISILKHVLFIKSDAVIPDPGKQLSFMLHELVFFGCHSHFASYRYTFAPYLYSYKILQPYVTATVRMHSDGVSSSTGAPLMKTITKYNSRSLPLNIYIYSTYIYGHQALWT